MKWLSRSIPDTIFTRVLSALCKMGIVVLTAQFFGAEGRGYIGVLAYAMTFFMLLSEFVGGSSIITLVPQNKLKDLLVPSYLWAVFVCVSGYFILNLFPEVPKDLHLHILGLSLLLAFTTINYSLLIGKQRLKWQNWSALSIVLTHLIFLLLVVWIGNHREIIQYIYGLYLGEVIGFVLSAVYLYKNFSKEFVGPISWKTEIYKLGAQSQFGHLIQFFNYRLSYIFILEYMSQSALGIYSTAFVLPEMIWIFGNSIGSVLHMKVVNKEKDTPLRPMVWKYTRWSFTVTLILVGIILLIPAEFWAYVLGEEFKGIKEVFYWLVPGVLALGLSTCISHYYHAIKRFTVLIYANGVGLTVKLLILFFYGSELTLNAVGIASSMGLVSICLFLLIHYINANHRNIKTSAE